jgi:hypothetical protein
VSCPFIDELPTKTSIGLITGGYLKKKNNPNSGTPNHQPKLGMGYGIGFTISLPM